MAPLCVPEALRHRNSLLKCSEFVSNILQDCKHFYQSSVLGCRQFLSAILQDVIDQNGGQESNSSSLCSIEYQVVSSPFAESGQFAYGLSPTSVDVTVAPPDAYPDAPNRHGQLPRGF